MTPDEYRDAHGEDADVCARCGMYRVECECDDENDDCDDGSRCSRCGEYPTECDCEDDDLCDPLDGDNVLCEVDE